MVPGRGPQPALGMIVGESPNQEDIAAGHPFAGKEGKLLEVALRAAGTSRDEIYITNVVKDLCVNSEGKLRRPKTEEIEEWRMILEGEVQNTAPVSILALGRTAFEALTGAYGEFKWAESKIENVYGAWHPRVVQERGGVYHYLNGPKHYHDWLEQIRPWAESLR